MERLPTEILEQVIDFIDDKPTLASLRLTAIKCLPKATTRLFKSLTVTLDNCINSFTMLMTRRHLIPYIKEVALGRPNAISQFLQLDEEAIDERRDLIITILRVTKLSALSVHDTERTKYLEIARRAMMPTNSLKTFRVSSTSRIQDSIFTGNVLGVLERCPNLEELELGESLAHEFFAELYTQLLKIPELKLSSLTSLICPPVGLMSLGPLVPSLRRYQCFAAPSLYALEKLETSVRLESFLSLWLPLCDAHLIAQRFAWARLRRFGFLPIRAEYVRRLPIHTPVLSFLIPFLI